MVGASFDLFFFTESFGTLKRSFWIRQRLDFVNGIFVIGFTGQVKKIWQGHIFFIFDGSKRMDSRFGLETSGWGRVSTMFKPRTN